MLEKPNMLGSFSTNFRIFIFYLYLIQINFFLFIYNIYYILIRCINFLRTRLYHLLNLYTYFHALLLLCKIILHVNALQECACNICLNLNTFQIDDVVC